MKKLLFFLLFLIPIRLTAQTYQRVWTNQIMAKTNSYVELLSPLRYTLGMDTGLFDRNTLVPAGWVLDRLGVFAKRSELEDTARALRSAGGLTPMNNIWYWDPINKYYSPYPGQQLYMSFYLGSVMPTLNERLNLDASLFTTNLTSGGLTIKSGYDNSQLTPSIFSSLYSSTILWNFNPRTGSGNSAVAFSFNTYNTLTEGKLWSMRNHNVEKAFFGWDGLLTSAALSGTGDRIVGVDNTGKLKIFESYKTVTLSASQIFNREWVQIIPAQPSGKMAIIERAVCFYNFNTTAFNTNEFTLRISYYYDGTDPIEFPPAYGFLMSTSDNVLTNMRLSMYSLTPSSNAVFIQNATDMTAPSGDGTLTITLYYSVIDI